jgi:hypothetical protein
MNSRGSPQARARYIVRVGVKAAMAKIRTESSGETMEQVKEWVQKAKETAYGRKYLPNHEGVSLELLLPELLILTLRAASICQGLQFQIYVHLLVLQYPVVKGADTNRGLDPGAHVSPKRACLLTVLRINKFVVEI